MSYNPRRISGRSAVDVKTSALENPEVPIFYTMQLFAFSGLVSNGSIQTSMLA